MIRITTQNIEDYRGALTVQPGDFAVDIWSVFDRNAFEACSNSHVVGIEHIVSTKNQLEDPKFLSGMKGDPRKTALDRMRDAAAGKLERRAPIAVEEQNDGTYEVLDGNATAQILMLAGWKEVAVTIMRHCP